MNTLKCTSKFLIFLKITFSWCQTRKEIAFDTEFPILESTLEPNRHGFRSLLSFQKLSAV